MAERENSESDELSSDVKLSEIRDQIRQAYSNSEVIRLVKSAFEMLGIELLNADLQPSLFKAMHFLKIRGVLINLNIPMNHPLKKEIKMPRNKEIKMPRNKEVKMPRNAYYYNNADFLEHDLTSAARSKGKKDLCEIRVHGNEQIYCANKEVVYWHTYLLNAAVELGMAKKATEAARIKGLVLITLFQKLGCKVEYKCYKGKSENEDGSKRADQYIITKVTRPEK